MNAAAGQPLGEEWKARAAEHGFGVLICDSSGVFATVRPASTVRPGPASARSPRLTEKQTTFTLPEVVCGVAGTIRGGSSPS